MRFLLPLFVVAALCCRTLAAPAPDATRLYEQGNYGKAAAQWRDAAKGNSVSAALLHNLGNAEFKAGDLGAAITSWERAHALDPWNRNSIANLRFARGEAGLEQPSLAWYEVYSSWIPPDAWLWAATVLFWSGLACLFVPPLLKRRRTAATQGGAVVAISLFLLTVPALAGIGTRYDLGVVIAPQTPLRLTPTMEGETLGALPAGALARVEIERGSYLYIRGETDRAGWVRRDEFTRLWP